MCYNLVNSIVVDPACTVGCFALSQNEKGLFYEQTHYQKDFDAARMHRDDCIVRHERISCGLQDDDRKD